VLHERCLKAKRPSCGRSLLSRLASSAIIAPIDNQNARMCDSNHPSCACIHLAYAFYPTCRVNRARCPSPPGSRECTFATCSTTGEPCCHVATVRLYLPSKECETNNKRGATLEGPPQRKESLLSLARHGKAWFAPHEEQDSRMR
jgi:hypothetical protein